MATQVALWLSHDAQLELYLWSYAHPTLNRPVSCIRGRTSGAQTSTGTFQWTLAVRALTLLFIKTKLHALGDLTGNCCIEGYRGSYASSLDDALYKEPCWLTEFFGVDSAGRPFAKRAFLRTNPGLKRPGPTAVALNPKFLENLQMEIYVNRAPVNVASELRSLLSLLEQGEKPTALKVAKNIIGGTKTRDNTQAEVVSLSLQIEKEHKPADAKTAFIDFLRVAFSREVYRSLRTRTAFSNSRHSLFLKSCLENPYFKKISGKIRTEDLRYLVKSRNTESLLGMSGTTSLLQQEKAPLRIWICSACAGALTIFQHLQETQRMKLTINYEFASVNPIRSLMIQGDYCSPAALPHFCLGNLPLMARALGGKFEYLPVMVLPKVSHRLIQTGFDGKRKAPTKADLPLLLFNNNEIGSSWFYYEKLKSIGRLPSSQRKVVLFELSDLADLFSSEAESFNSILWFPHNMVYSRLFRCKELDGPELADSETILFARRDIASNEPLIEEFQVHIRDSWLTLLYDAAVREAMIDKLFMDRRYSDILARSCNLNALTGVFNENEIVQATQRGSEACKLTIL